MTARRLYLDDGPGERRGVVTLHGLPERLLIERPSDLATQQPGARLIARVRRIERALNAAFLDLGAEPDGLLPLSTMPKGLAEGAWIAVEIAAAARGGKGPVTRFMGVGEGPCRLLSPPPALETRLSNWAPSQPIIGGSDARLAADVAEDAALTVEHPLPSGGRIFIEPTQALVAVDIDLGATGGDGRRAAVRANLEGVAAAARLLRLKGLGGLVAIDLAGKGHDGARLSEAAKTAFAADGVGVVIGPISRFGVLELSTPRSFAPIAEVLLNEAGLPTVETLAYRLLRAIENAAGPGLFIEATCAPAVAEAAARFSPALADRIGPRFRIQAEASLPAEDQFVRAR